MSEDRDRRVARLGLRLHVGEDGDPLDNDILEAYESLPESTIIRNDWIRRRLVIGHLLEREGISGLLAVIGGLSGGAQPTVAAPRPVEPPEPEVPPELPPFKIPEFNEGPAAEIEHRVSAPAQKPDTTVKKKMLGLMPAISLPDAASQAPESEAGADMDKVDSATASEDAQRDEAESLTHADETGPKSVRGEISTEAEPEQSAPAEMAKQGPHIEALQQPVVRVPAKDHTETSQDLSTQRPVPSDPVDDTRAMLERFATAGEDGGEDSAPEDFNPVLESDFQG